MKPRLALAAALVLAVGLLIWFATRPLPAVVSPAAQPGGSPPPNQPAVTQSTSAPSSAATIPAPKTTGAQPPRPAQLTPVPPRKPTPPARTVYMPPDPVPVEGQIDLQNTRRMLSDYRQIMGENPTGTNAEIMKSLMGGNKKGAMLGPPPGMSLNSDGELIDRWGKPIFFHQLSRDKMEIRSAGPDGVMWTADDEVTQ